MGKKKEYSEGMHINRKSKIGIAVCCVLFVALFVLQVLTSDNATSGIIAQLQVMISVTMVGLYYRWGYRFAIIMNIIISVITLIRTIATGDPTSIPGVAVPLCTVVTVTILLHFGSRLNSTLFAVSTQKAVLEKQKKELETLNVTLEERNAKLTEYNGLIREKEDKLSYLAYFDVLTELPNRRMMFNRIEFFLNVCERENKKFAIVFIDIDNFKTINDTLGHSVGDTLLKELAKRFQAVIDSADIVGRLGGDEFAVVIQRELTGEQYFEAAEKLRAVILQPFEVDNNHINISASFGAAIYPTDGDNVSDLCKSADMAVYKAKDTGKNRIRFFKQEMQAQMLERIEVESHLTKACENNQFFLMFQPQYTSSDKRLRGFEALVRWKVPDIGVVSPLKFIPMAEEIGIISEIGEWILDNACKHISRFGDSVMSVNISAIQLMEVGFIETVKRVISANNIDPKQLEFEITESVFISSMERAVEVLNSIREMGIRIALDDFGTGYSSLNYLYRLPIDTLKIDKSFIDNITSDNDDEQIVGSIISLAHKMGMHVVAEGVENPTQLKYLVEQKCDYIQGYLWGKPLSENDAESVVNEALPMAI